MMLGRRWARWVVLALFVPACATPAHRDTRWLLGDEEVSIEIYTATAPDAELALGDARELIEHAAAMMSGSRPESELALLNQRAATGYYPIQDSDLYRCLLLALDYSKASRGAFDPSVGALTELYRASAARSVSPSSSAVAVALATVGWADVTVANEARAVHFRRSGLRIDLGGVAQGYALDMAARVLTRPGSRAALLRYGGSVYAWSHPPGRSSWSVKLPDPRQPEQSLLSVEVANRGVAVSGNPRGPGQDAARLVLDPATGRPPSTQILAAVAIADSAADADALSTALFVSGYYRATDLLERMRQVEAILLVEDEAPYLLASASLGGRIMLAPRVDEETGGRVRFLLPPQP